MPYHALRVLHAVHVTPPLRTHCVGTSFSVIYLQIYYASWRMPWGQVATARELDPDPEPELELEPTTSARQDEDALKYAGVAMMVRRSTNRL